MSLFLKLMDNRLFKKSKNELTNEAGIAIMPNPKIYDLNLNYSLYEQGQISLNDCLDDFTVDACQVNTKEGSQD